MPIVPAIWEAKIGSIAVKRHGEQEKVARPPSQPVKSWMLWCVPVIPSTQEA
jgi:hypothetical protein